MKHPVSSLCAMTMSAALAALIASGILLWKIDLLPDWSWLQQSAGAICVLAFAAIGVAAVASGVCAAAHAERAWRAGGKYSHVRNAALAFAAGCVAVDVLAAHVGIEILNGEQISMPPAWVTSAGSIFIALARPIMAFVLRGVDGIAADEALAQERAEHDATMADIRARTEEARARTEAGIVELGGKRSGLKTATAGATFAAVAATLAMGSGHVTLIPPTPEISPVTSNELQIPTPTARADLDPAGVWERGPRRSNRAKFEMAVAMVEEGAEVADIGRELGVDMKTARQWRGWAQAILARDGNVQA